VKQESSVDLFFHIASTGSFDSAVSISEEATNAATAVPWAIVGAIVSATISGFAILVVLALTMG
jgi:hypothetical protein